MPILQQYLFAIGAFQGLLLSGLLSIDTKITTASRILGIWCLLLSLGFLDAFITMNEEVNYFSGLIGWFYFLPASYGAFIYLYCKYAITDQRFALNDFWHISPTLICYLLNIDILFAAPEVKLDLVLFHPPESISFFVSELIMYSQAFVYLGFSIALIRQYQKKAVSTLSNFNPDIFGWLWKLVILYIVIWCFKLIPSTIEGAGILSKLGDGLIVVLIYSVAMAQWRSPNLFKIELLTKQTDLSEDKFFEQSSFTEQLADRDESKKYGALDAEIRSSLLKNIRQYMQEQQAYLDSDLTLTRLSDAIGISTHHLSEVLNQQEGKNFYQFVNKYRVDYICAQLEVDRTIKILDLAMSAGFSSKSTFNGVFKQFTGLTPSQYRKKLSAE